MRRGTVVWIDLVALLVGGAVYEIPNVALNLRYHRNIFIHVRDNVGRVVSDRLIASDREADEILRYAIRRNASYADRRDAKVPATEYPQNEFFLAEWAEKLASAERPDLHETLALLWFDGAILISICHSSFLRTGDFSGGPRG